MPVVAIYNNKGGVGKSTLTVGLAEFLAADRGRTRGRSTLVIDLDAQASSSGAILGRAAVRSALDSNRTLPHLVADLLRTRRQLRDLSQFVTKRPKSAAKGSALAGMDVMVADKPGLIEVEEQMRPDRDCRILRDCLKPAVAAYEFVLIDLPGNIDRRNRIAVAALVMCDYVLVPVEPTEIALNALPDTFEMVELARRVGGTAYPTVLGLVLNKADRRDEQYRSKFIPILEAAANGSVPPVFDNIIPDTPKLATATDGTHDFHTLKDRFDTYYDHVRKVTEELKDRCDRSHVSARASEAQTHSGWLRAFLADAWGTLRRSRQTTQRTREPAATR